MSKEQTNMLKGIAILLMLFLHLFNKGNLAEVCTPLLYLGDTPLVTVMSRATNPVGFFIILSGYGLSCVYDHGRLDAISQCRRLLKLYLHYWIVLLVFVSIGHFIVPDKYPGDIYTIFGNVVGCSNTYNTEHWFLFPYVLLSLSASLIFRIMDRFGKWKTTAASCLLYFFCGFVVSRYVAPQRLYDTVTTATLTYFNLMFTFIIGALLYRIGKEKGLEIQFLASRRYLVLPLLVCIFAIKCLPGTNAFGFLYVTAFVILFIHLHVTDFIKRALLSLGKHSMVIWLTHTFFSNYLFPDFIFSFRYPIVIYLVLLTISYAVSFPIMWAAGHAFEMITSREKA